ncbi:MAG TPA: hypothetical protein VGS21_08190 [Acidimicrobiales bacterium]|nr:hypothetical protein [Acidimicrobiales bacterium]
MNGYVEAGYAVVLGSLVLYSGGLLRRERVVASRLRPVDPRPVGPGVDTSVAADGDAGRPATEADTER